MLWLKHVDLKKRNQIAHSNVHCSCRDAKIWWTHTTSHIPWQRLLLAPQPLKHHKADRQLLLAMPISFGYILRFLLLSTQHSSYSYKSWLLDSDILNDHLRHEAMSKPSKVGILIRRMWSTSIFLCKMTQHKKNIAGLSTTRAVGFSVIA